MSKKNNTSNIKFDESGNRLYMTAYGDVIKPGQKFLLNGKEFEIISLSIVKWAGLIADYDECGLIRRHNISSYIYDSQKDVFRNKDNVDE